MHPRDLIYISGESVNWCCCFGKSLAPLLPAPAVTCALTQQSLRLLRLWDGERAHRQEPVRTRASESMEEAGCRGGEQLSHARDIEVSQRLERELVIKCYSNGQ